MNPRDAGPVFDPEAQTRRDDQREEGSGAEATPAGCRLTLPNTREAVDAAIARFLRHATEAGIPHSTVFGLRLALEEALSNALHHGNANDPARQIHVEYAISPREIVVEIEDEGEGFDPAAVPDPTQEENLQIPAGRGLILMRAYMTSVESLGRGNRVRMRWRAGQERSSQEDRETGRQVR